ncbi:MAG: winged helix-turn-helix domain-containing protein [Fusobacterium periodonticum]|nr:winged helix-turn-helix domain-containing protein [Fusobacterium periodonticum]
MTKIEEVLEYLRCNTYATNKEISDDLNISEGVVRTYINRLKNKGYLEKTGTEYRVLKEMPVNKSSYKQEIIKEMLEVYMDDFRELKVMNEKIRVGELIIRLVDKL